MYSFRNSPSDTTSTRRVARMIRVTAAAFGLIVAAPQYVQAASFPCRYAVSISERLVCADPKLSLFDDVLAALYVQAKNLATDRDALEADRVAQWSWRQRQCKNKACVSDWYIRRIAELNADIQQGQKSQIVSLKANLTAQDIPSDAQDAVLELKGLRPPSDAGKQ